MHVLVLSQCYLLWEFTTTYLYCILLCVLQQRTVSVVLRTPGTEQSSEYDADRNVVEC